MIHIKLDQSVIIRYLHQNTRDCFDRWFLLEKTTSTNDIIHNELRKPFKKNAVCLAECQTHGRGRLGRPWISPAYCHIYLSFSWHFQCDLNSIQGLSLFIGDAIIQTLQNLYPALSFYLKWPNDIFFDKKKLGGILIEALKTDNGCVAVIGIGLNVHSYHDESKSIDQPWITLDEITKTRNDRNKIIGEILNSICTKHTFIPS